MTPEDLPDKAAFFAPYTEHVGTERAMINVAAHFEDSGVDVDLLRLHGEWPERSNPPGRIVSLDTDRSRWLVERLPPAAEKFALAAIALRRVSRYLEREEPDVLLAGLLSSVAVQARERADADPAVLITVQGLPRDDWIRRLVWPRTYPKADAIVAPAAGVERRSRELVGAALTDEIEVVPNPVITDRVVERGQERPDHPWFDDDVPVVVGVGRQTRQKDFETLLRAVADLRERRDVRLVVPGAESERTPHLRRLQRRLGIDDVVDFPGFVDNPYAYVAAADVFVLSSRFEGPGHVLLEALALGTPAVATDCPAGPREILNDGAAGELVPVGEPGAMADAVGRVLDDPSLRERYVDAGLDAVEPYRAERGSARYLELCRDLVASDEGADA